MSDVTHELQELLDKHQIHEALMRFCRGVDRLDEELIRSAYHVDAYDDHGVIKGTVDEFVDVFLPMARRYFASTSHIIANEFVELDGDVAKCESYYVAVTVQDTEDGQVQETHYGRYVDRFEKRAEGWRIAHRVAVIDATRSDDVRAPEGGPDPTLVLKGRRDREDAVYSLPPAVMAR